MGNGSFKKLLHIIFSNKTAEEVMERNNRKFYFNIEYQTIQTMHPKAEIDRRWFPSINKLFKNPQNFNHKVSSKFHSKTRFLTEFPPRTFEKLDKRKFVLFHQTPQPETHLHEIHARNWRATAPQWKFLKRWRYWR